MHPATLESGGPLPRSGIARTDVEPAGDDGLHAEPDLAADRLGLRSRPLEQRFSSLSADLFKRVLDEVLPLMAARWATRPRPLPPALQ